jgi:uncharacterized BrkB/YihY/UPF0761 family membrane protein
MPIEFFKLVSQIIPLLFLAVSLQSIFIARKEKYKASEKFLRNIHILDFVCLVIVLVLGEFAALSSVYKNTPNTNYLIVVCISLLAAVLWIVAEYLLSLIGKNKNIYFVGFMILGILFEILFFLRFVRL